MNKTNTLKAEQPAVDGIDSAASAPFPTSASAAALVPPLAAVKKTAARKPAVKAAVKPALKAAAPAAAKVEPAATSSVDAKPKAPAAKRKPVAAVSETKPAATAAAPVAAAKAPAKPAAAKAAAKPAAKAVAKPAVKTAAKAPAKLSAKAKADAAAAEAAKARKPKLVRDSFTMPEPEYAVLGQVKKACLKAGFEIKKSELLRVGVVLISQIDIATLQSVLGALPQLKTGRPKKN